MSMRLTIGRSSGAWPEPRDYSAEDREGRIEEEGPMVSDDARRLACAFDEIAACST